MKKLTPAEIRAALPAVPEWKRRGAVISRTWILEDFPAALAFVLRVGRLAEAAQHHPDIDIRWNRVTLALTTHDAGGLTARDFQLAAQLDGLNGGAPRRRRKS
ncbi:MAG: 4a-hydroxytetrahydrobiopterin dehydratase [Verrucomicrobia bacterium]|nr:4a-hydroxytetrahydrobiopterin dehydratase [Verrucomicrobiota bacterium]